VHRFDDGRRDAVWRLAGVKIGFEGIEAVLQGHGFLPFRRASVRSPASQDIIYSPIAE